MPGRRRRARFPSPLGRKAAGNLEGLERRISAALAKPAFGSDPELRIIARCAAGNDSYQQLRRTTNREWQGQKYATGAWPPQIDSAQVALLLPFRSPGRIGVAAGKPREAHEPFFAISALGDLHAERLALSMIAEWMEQNVARLTPPVLEFYLRGRFDSRELLLPDLAWHLPRVDGL